MRQLLPLIAILGLFQVVASAQNFYEVKFPDDQVVFGCSATADTVWPIVNQYDCNLNVGISVTDQVFYTNDTEGCYKIDRRWRLINWCWYNAAWSPSLIMNPPNSNIGPTVMGNFNNNGFLEYHQIIKVLDTGAPTFTDCPANPVVFCDFSDNDPSQYHSNHLDYCESVVDLSITATDVCSGSDLSFRYLLLLDKNNDGIKETLISSSDAGAWPITTSVSGNNITGHVQFPPGVGLPYGNHEIKWIAGDHCGNESVCAYYFEVKDCKAPTVVCLNGISVNIMQTGMISIADTTLIEYAYDNCTPAYQIETGFVKSLQNTGSFPTGSHVLTFDCNEIGTQAVDIWVRDAYGNDDFCTTTILVQDNNGGCAPAGSLKGQVFTEQLEPVPGAQLQLKNSSGNLQLAAVTDAGGNFQIDGQYAACQYQLSPWLDSQSQSGVNALDALLTAAYLSENIPLAGPYALLAADVDQSGALDNNDVVQMVQTATGINSAFPAAPAWTFVPAVFAFPDPQHPWPAPQALEFCLSANADYTADFVAVKTGDVDGSASPGTEDRKELPAVWFTAPDWRFEPGEQLRIAVETPDLSDLPAFQFTLGYDPAYLSLDAVEPGMAPENYTGVFPDQNRITAAWLEPMLLSGAISAKNLHGTVFTLVMTAQQIGKVSDALFLTDNIAATEVYNKQLESLPAGLAFTPVRQSLNLEPAQPNPATDHVSLRWYQPEPGNYQIYLTDLNGAPLIQQNGQANTGWQTLQLPLSGAIPDGVLLLSVGNEKEVAVQRVVVLR